MIAWIRHWSLSRRIAVTMLLALVAVQAQAFVQVWLFANPEVRLTGTRWLAEQVATVAREAAAVPPEQRPALLRTRSEGLPVNFRTSPAPPFAAAATDPVGHRLRTTLIDALGADPAAVLVAPIRLLTMFPIDSLGIQVTPPEVSDRLGAAPVRDGDPEVLIPVTLRIAIRLNDGTWLSADPIGFVDGQSVRLVPFTVLLVGAGIVTLVSTAMARRIVAPLGRLIVAAEAVGTAHGPVTVPLAGLGEFAAVAQAFEDMQRRLIRFVSERTEMLAAISHDLRSALTRLRIAVENGSPADAVLAEVHDMTVMVESTLAFASGEAHSAPSEPVDLAALLISLVDDAADSGARCDYQGPDHCVTIGNPLALKRAFVNLIDNALHYGAAAHIHLDPDRPLLRIIVADEGPGIPPDLVAEAFRPFRRLDPARSGHPGIGLGLTIARDVVNSHGGSLALANGQQGGLHAIVDLPVSRERESAHTGLKKVATSNFCEQANPPLIPRQAGPGSSSAN